jgi:hypothetical protein
MTDRIAVEDQHQAPEAVTEEEAAILDEPEAEFDFDGPPEDIDETQVLEAELVEKDKEWIDWRERVGGEE